MGKIEDILIDGNQKNASDIHLCPGSPVMFRIDGDLIPMSEEKIKPYEIEEMIKPMLTTEQLEVLEREGELDVAHSIAGFNRVRVNVFRQRGTYAMALRILSFEIPSPKDLGVPEAVVNLNSKKRGMVLVTRATGSGKTTFLNALSAWIPPVERIITIEDSAELKFQGLRNLVRLEARSSAAGGREITIRELIKTALRMRPDRIIVGEVRDGACLDMLQAIICTI